MTSPFQSIISTAEVGEQVEGNDNSYSEAVAEVEAISVAPDEPPSAGIKTGIGAAAKNAAGSTALPRRKPLRGGEYSDGDALKLLNSYYFVGKNNQETAIFRINDDGSAAFVTPEQFKLEVQNIFVKPSSGSKKSAEKFWKEHELRHQREMVFKPEGTTQPHEFNMWRGFGVAPRRGRRRLRLLIRHIREVICRRDRKKYKYLMRLLAWMVQNPGKPACVVLMLKSSIQGTGKSTLGKVMLDIFGEHGALIDDQDRLLGRFNDHLETLCFVLAEEMLFAGDHKATDKFKSVITGETIQIEGKYRRCRQVPNRLKIMATSNHDHAVAAGVRDRRYIVFDVGDERVGDRAWFDTLYKDLADGGTSEFLNLLQNVQLGDWHPRDILKTAETTEQQRMSGDNVSQWSQACIEADAIIGAARGPYGSETTHDLGTTISTAALGEAYRGFCKQNGLRPLSVDGFGKACGKMFGERKRLQAPQDDATGRRMPRPWGYQVPEGNEWQEKVDERLGIKK